MSHPRPIRGNPRQTRAYIGLGSNVGDRLGYVQQAMQLLKDVPRIKVLECSSLYETEPKTGNSGAWFVNAVASIDTNLSAQELLEVLKDIEMRLSDINKSEGDDCSVTRNCQSQPRKRIIDLDILFYGQDILDSAYLRVPHPNVVQRAYALVPLLEIAPDFVHPRLRKTVTQLHEELPKPEIVYLYGTRGSPS